MGVDAVRSSSGRTSANPQPVRYNSGGKKTYTRSSKPPVHSGQGPTQAQIDSYLKAVHADKQKKAAEHRARLGANDARLAQEAKVKRPEKNIPAYKGPASSGGTGPVSRAAVRTSRGSGGGSSAGSAGGAASGSAGTPVTRTPTPTDRGGTPGGSGGSGGGSGSTGPSSRKFGKGRRTKGQRALTDRGNPRRAGSYGADRLQRAASKRIEQDA